MITGRIQLRTTARLVDARRPLNALLRTPLFSALAAPRGVDGYLRLVDETWSARHVRARLVGIDRETDDAVSLWLMPNENWRGFRAGQFVLLSVWVGGVRHTRSYSISSAPGDGLPLRVTLEVRPTGRVSSAWLRHARAGDVVELSPAMGEFVLPDPVPSRLLFVSGGSGITPLVSMARHLEAMGYPGSLAWVHYARRRVMLGAELGALARRQPGVQLDVELTRPGGSDGPPAPRLSRQRLDALVPDWRLREVFACGPASMLGAVAAVWRDGATAGRLHVERFDTPAPATSVRHDEASYRLVFARSGREARGHGQASLLAQAEQAGLLPRHGCRIGICHRCRCVKRSGVVRNQLTGVLDDEPGKAIQLCITTPCSDVILEL